MLYRKMKKANPKLAILGFGCMRLPVREDGRIDEAKAKEMVRFAIDHGLNYVDTAYPYHNGESEPFVGRALQDGYKEKVNLATKLPCWLISTRNDMDFYLNKQLKLLNTDQIDFYLLHGLTKPSWEQLLQLNVIEFLDAALTDGRIRYAGFSFHDQSDTFKQIVDAYDWTFCQIQYNFMDEHYQAGTEGLHYAADKGLGIVIMEPLRGGMLTREVPSVKAIWSEADTQRSFAEWGLRWVWNHPEVTVVLSGMSTIAQVKENLKYTKHGSPNSLSRKDFEVFERVKAEYTRKMKVDCTGCQYCMPCPEGVNIPECFASYNAAYMFEDPVNAKLVYNVFLSGANASKCKKCKTCEELCPQKIPIPQKLVDVAAFFEN